MLVYWINFPATGLYGSIGRASINGSHVHQKFVSHVFYPFGLALDGH